MSLYLTALRTLAAAREEQAHARTVGDLAASVHPVQAARNVARLLTPEVQRAR